jgi:hypothetical protein
MPLQKTAKERKERGSDESQFVIMALIPCQVSFNMKERVYSAYTEGRIEQRKEERKKEGRRKRKNERKQ